MKTPVHPKLYWLMMEVPNIFFTALMMWEINLKWTDERILIVSMFWLHYFLRIVVFTSLLRGGTPNPLGELWSAALFTAVNGTVQVAWHMYYTVYPPGYMYSVQFMLGVAIFFLGMLINHHSDSILRNLRKDDNDRGHYIPRGGLFEYVSGANYFGEILEWFGYAVAAGTIPAFFFFVSTAVVTGLRAILHHKWYQAKFEDEYPKDRTVVIPFIF